MKLLYWVMLIGFFQPVWAQEYSRDQINEMSKLFGYHLGQSMSLDMIQENNPKLSKELLIAKHEWNKRFKPATEKVEKDLKEYFGDYWPEYEKELKFKLNEILNQNITYSESSAFVEEMQDRADGIMDPTILDLLLKYHPKYITQPAFEFSDGYTQNYKCSNCDKSQGLSFSFDYPESWVLRKGKRSSVLFLTTSSNVDVVSDMGIQLTCTINNISESFTFWEQLLLYLSDAPTDEILSEELFDVEGIKLIMDEITGGNYSAIEQKNIRLNMKPGYMVDYSMEIQQLDYNLKSLSRMYLVIIDGNLFNFTFFIGKPIGKNQSEHQKLFKKYKPIMQMVTNSVVLY